MCLERIVDIKITKNYGWKAFHQNDKGKLFSQLQEMGKIRPLDKWIKAKSYIIRIPRGSWPSYTSGFHIFFYKKDAIRWKGKANNTVIKKVYFKGVVTTGIQSVYEKFKDIPASIIVAKYIKIEGDYNG